VTSPPATDPARPGLRERKKAKTRALIQQHALRLFREHGYAETTVEQIAEAAEVSPSTFFRYFPSKEDVVVYDAIDPLLEAAYRAQPAEMRPLAAARAAMHVVFGQLTAAQIEEQRERTALSFAVPELQGAMIRQVIESGRWFAGLIAERAGRDPDDLAVRVFAGALTGALVGALVPSLFEDPSGDWVGVLDETLDLIEAGFPL